MFANTIQSKMDSVAHGIMPEPRKQIMAQSMPQKTKLFKAKYQNFILDKPAIKLMMSSGKPGIKKKTGSIILLLQFTKACAYSNSSFLMSFDANLLPNLYPKKYIIESPTISANHDVKKVVFAPKRYMPIIVKVGSAAGIKHKITNVKTSNKKNAKIPYFPVDDIRCFNLFGFVRLKCFKIKNVETLINAKINIISNSFIHFFITHYMNRGEKSIKKSNLMLFYLADFS